MRRSAGRVRRCGPWGNCLRRNRFAGEGPTGDWAQGTRGRTKNMAFMSVTLDVSILSGWLNTDAPCRVERRAHELGRGEDEDTGRAWG